MPTASRQAHHSDSNTYQQSVVIAALTYLREHQSVLACRGNLVAVVGSLEPTRTQLRLTFDHGEVVEALAYVIGLATTIDGDRVAAHGQWLGGSVTIVGQPPDDSDDESATVLAFPSAVAE